MERIVSAERLGLVVKLVHIFESEKGWHIKKNIVKDWKIIEQTENWDIEVSVHALPPEWWEKTSSRFRSAIFRSLWMWKGNEVKPVELKVNDKIPFDEF